MRWSSSKEKWLLERKANYRRADINPDQYPREAIDTFIRMRDGFYLVGQYEPKRLPHADRLVAYLRSQDPDYMDLGPGDALTRATRLAARIEEREEAERQGVRRSNTFEHSGAGADLYDKLAWDEGRRVAVPRTAQGLA